MHSKVCNGFKGNPCVVTSEPQPLESFYKHKRGKFGRTAICNKCDNLRGRLYYQNNKGVINKIASDYRKANPDKNRSYASLRRLRVRNATPPWVEDYTSEIQNVYAHARDCEVVTGEPYEVDHIIPLSGKNVCGLHVPWNLQVLPRDINRKKGISYEEITSFSIGGRALKRSL